MGIKQTFVLAALCFTLNPTQPATAQSYPTQPIKIIVPAGAGGPTDVLARVVAQGLHSRIGQTVFIENRPGAGGATGAKAASAAQPDGYTLFLGNTATLAVLPAVSRNPGYDPSKNFAAVAKITDSYQVLVVHPSLPGQSVQELIAFAKANPGKLNFASSGTGNLTHLAGELFKSRAGIDIVHVPYKSDAESISAILGGQVQLTFASVTVLLPLIREGKLKALAVTSASRSSELPGLPTMLESGVAGYVVTTFFGIMTPAGTPESIVTKLNAAINQTLTSAETKETLAKLGAEPKPGTPDDFARYVAAEYEKLRLTANSAGVKID